MKQISTLKKGMLVTVAAASIFTGCIRQTDYRKGLEERKFSIDSALTLNSRKIDSLGKINKAFERQLMKGGVDSVANKLKDATFRNIMIDSLQGANSELGNKKDMIEKKLEKLPE